RRWARLAFFDQLRCQPNEASGRQPQHQQQQEPDEEQTILSKERKDLRQQHNDQGSHQRAEESVGAANHHYEKKQDRLKEREGFGADEVGHRREHGAGESGGDRRNRECGGSDQRRIKPNRLTRNFGIADRAHGFAPWAGAQLGVEKKRQNREAEHEERHLAL